MWLDSLIQSNARANRCSGVEANLDEQYLKKRIEILLEWKSVLLCLAEGELSPFDKWCAEINLVRKTLKLKTY